MSGTGTQEKKDELQARNAVAEALVLNESPKNGSVIKDAISAFLSNPIFQSLLLVALCLACFGRTLGSYFLADDIGEVRYIYQIFNNNQWDLFWSNFTGNYMQVPNMAVYRPILMLSLVIDFLFWKGNALGYYITNLGCFLGSTILLYTFLRQLSADWGRTRSSLAAFFASALFASTPLHCESISWVVGRVDSLCCLFYLAALNCFLRARTKPSILLTAAGIGLFFLAMGTKEMAIGLAPTLMAIGFLWTQPKSAQFVSQVKERALSAWRFSRTIWAATVVYFVIRWLALGTLLGGYAGSVGASQSANALSKWMDGDSWKRLVLPFSSEVFNAGSSNETMLFACYCGLLSIVIVRALAGSLPWKWILFLTAWALTQLAPIYRLFGIGANLEGARFCFFFSMSFSSLLPILLFSPDKKNLGPLSGRLAVISALLLLGATLVLAKTAYASNIVWLHAGKEVRSVLQDAQRLASTAAEGTKFALLGIPKEHGGAHMILNGSTFEMLLSPPFSNKNYSESFITFDPMLFGDDTAINGSRFRQIINRSHASKPVEGPLVWNGQSKRFELVRLASSPRSDRSVSLIAAKTEALSRATLLPFVADHAVFTTVPNGIRISNPNAGDGVLISNSSINPMDVAYVKMHLESTTDLTKAPFDLRWKSASAAWNDENSIRVIGTNSNNTAKSNTQTITFPVGRKWRWYSQESINDIAITVPPLNDMTIEKIELLPADQLTPIVTVKELPCTNSGAYYTAKTFSVSLSSPASEPNSTPDQAKYLVEVSKNNHFFENFSKANEKLAVLKSFEVTGKDFTVKPEQLEGEGYYQIRARSLNAEGNATGDFSDPLTLLLQSNAAANKK